MKSFTSPFVACLLLAANQLCAATMDVAPGQSLQEAADRLQPGDTLLLAEGTYYQNIRLTRSGSAGNPITIKARTPGKSIISGAMEVTPNFEPVEGAIYKTKWVSKNWAKNGTDHAWVMADDRSLYNYASMEELRTFRKSGGTGNLWTPYEGFFYQDGELYVRLLGEANPNKVKLAISRPDIGSSLEIQGQQHIVIEGLQARGLPAY